MSDSAKGKPKLIVGSPVTDSDLFGRDGVIDLIWERLERNHVFLAAPRRFGKTSVMFALEAQPREGWTPVLLEVESIDTPAKFLTELTEALLPVGKVREIIRSFMGSMKGGLEEIAVWELKVKLREQYERDWSELGRRLMKELAEQGARHLVIIDEFPWMIHHVANRSQEEARLLLDWFRGLRPTPSLLGRIRFLLGGSIGIDSMLSQLGATHTLNDVQTIPIEPFHPDTAREFCQAISETEGLNLTPELITAILTTIGAAVPMFLVLLLSEISNLQRHKGHEITTELIERAYRERVLGPHCRNHFDHYFERLKKYYDSHTRTAAESIIKSLARTQYLPLETLHTHSTKALGFPMPKEGFSLLLTEMEKDFYIRFDVEQEKYTIASKVLRDWWLRHYGLLD